MELPPPIFSPISRAAITTNQFCRLPSNYNLGTICREEEKLVSDIKTYDGDQKWPSCGFVQSTLGRAWEPILRGDPSDNGSRCCRTSESGLCGCWFWLECVMKAATASSQLQLILDLQRFRLVTHLTTMRLTPPLQ